MDPFTIAAVGMGVLGAVGGADSAAAQVANQRMQIEWNNHLGKLKLQSDNRNIARKNAAQWMMNQEITASAYQQSAEENVYLRHKFENELGMFSTQTQQQTDAVVSLMSSRNISNDSGSSQALLRSSRARQHAILEDQAVSFGNMKRDVGRRRDQALSQRNFSYNDFMKFIPTDSSHLDPEAAYDDALVSGLIGVGVNAAVMMKADSVQTKLDAHTTEQMATLGQLTGDMNEVMQQARFQDWTSNTSLLDRMTASLALWSISP